MAETHARLRSDLEIRAESSELHSAIILKDPITRKFYRFPAVQAAVLAQLDGSSNAQIVATRVSEQFQTQVLPSQVEDFVGKLHKLLLLDNPENWAKLEGMKRPQNRFLSNLLSIKIHAVNPDNLLETLEQRLRFCFSTPFVILTCLSFFAGIVISILNWRSIYMSMGTLFSLYSIPLLLIVAFCVMTVHEFAHGLTLKHYGGRVEEMGLLILYFIPAFYCNVGDAWMLKRRERIMVGLAGGVVQLLIWAWTVILWRLLAPETLASQICLVAIAFTGIQTLFNFNPLIKLDGYYILSDYLQIPNLRSKSFSYIRAKLSGWIMGKSNTVRGVASRRENRVFAFYGIAASFFSMTLLFVILERLAGFMVREFRGWGIILFSSLCFMAIPATSKETLTASGKFLSGVATKIKKSPLQILTLAVLISGGFLPWELKVSGDFTILPSTKVSVSPEVEGTLKAIHADEGARIQRGDVLAEIENLELSDQYEETSGELRTQKSQLELLRAGTRPEEIERTKRLVETKSAELQNTLRVEQERQVLLDTIAKKQAELQNAQVNYERTEKLLSDGLVAKNESDRDRTAYEVQKKELSEAQGQLKVLEERTANTRDIKKKELEQAQSELQILLAGSRKEAIQAVEAQVHKLEEKLRILSQQLEYLKIKSPIDGVVTTPYLKNRIGEYLEKGSRLCDVVSEGTVIVELPVPEKEIADVHAGFPIIMKVRGYPHSSFEAQVKSIAPIAVEKNQERMVVVQGELENPDGKLKAGMTGVGKIFCGKRTVANLMTRRAIRWLRTEFWEYLP